MLLCPGKVIAHNRWETEPFGEVTVMASRVNPLPTGTSWRMSCAGEARRSFPACTVTIGNEAWEDSLGKWISLTDQLSRWAWKGSRHVSFHRRHREKRCLLFFKFLYIFFWASWGLGLCSEDLGVGSRKECFKCRTSTERTINMACQWYSDLILFQFSVFFFNTVNSSPWHLPCPCSQSPSSLPPLFPLMQVSSFPLLCIWPFHYAGISISLKNMWNRYADDLICWVL